MKKTEIGNKTANINIKTTVYPSVSGEGSKKAKS